MLDYLIQNQVFMLVAPSLSGEIILAITFATLTSGILGLVTKYKMFLIFSIGGYITLIDQFQDYGGIVVALIGVILFNLWFATIGSRI